MVRVVSSAPQAEGGGDLEGESGDRGSAEDASAQEVPSRSSVVALADQRVLEAVGSQQSSPVPEVVPEVAPVVVVGESPGDRQPSQQPGGRQPSQQPGESVAEFSSGPFKFPPPVISPSVLMVSDSIFEPVRTVPMSHVLYYQEASTLQDFCELLSQNLVQPNQYQFIVVCLGSEDIAQQELGVDELIGVYGKVFELLYDLNPDVSIGAVSILPRPIEDSLLGPKIILFNLKLRELVNKYRGVYIKVNTMLIHKKQILNNLFRPDGVHLNSAGIKVVGRALRTEIDRVELPIWQYDDEVTCDRRVVYFR